MVATLSNLDRSVKAGGTFYYVIKRSNKLEELEFDVQDEIIPEEELYRCLELYGIATDTYQVEFDGKTTTKLGILLRIIDENDPQHKGIFRTSVSYEGCGPRSMIGQIFTAILGNPFIGEIDNELWKSVLGGRFGATLNIKDKGDRTYTNLVHGSFKPVKSRAAKPAPAPALDPDEDPFGDEAE